MELVRRTIVEVQMAELVETAQVTGKQVIVNLALASLITGAQCNMVHERGSPASLAVLFIIRYV